MHKEITLSANINAAILDVMNIICELKDVYSEENTYLEEYDTEKFIAIQDKKIEAAQHYHTGMSQIMGRAEELKDAETNLKDRLKLLHAEFEILSKKNLESIERMQRCTEKLGNTLRSAVIKEAQIRNTFSYGENGEVPNTTKTRRISSGSISETA